MKGSELRARPAAELRGELLKLRKEQFALRLQRATGQAVKPDQFGKVRRSIARLKTALRANELGVAVAAEGAPAAQKSARKPGKPVAKAAAAKEPAAKKAPRAAKKSGAK